MSDDKRKNARTQGRFSSEKENHTRRKDKSKAKEVKGESDTHKGKPRELKSSVEGLSLTFDESSTKTVKELEERMKPEEIRTSGPHQLSSTENGISRVIYEPVFLMEDEAKELMTILHDSTQWFDKNIVIHGTEVPQPRRVAWYGPLPYSYSGAVLQAAEMPKTILGIKSRVEDNLKKYNLEVAFNSVLLNLYRNGKDSVAWHSDDELSMGIDPTIASVSLGEVRKFEMKPKPHTVEQDSNVKNDTVFFIHMKPGSLIIMDGSMQQDWKHQVPKEYHDKLPRINLTFRTVYPIDKFSVKVPSISTSVTSIASNSSSYKNSIIVDSADTDAWPSVDEHSNKPDKDDFDGNVNHSDENYDHEPCHGNDLNSNDSAISEVPITASPTSSQNALDQNSASQPDVLKGCNVELSSLGEISEQISSSHTSTTEKKFQFNANAPDFIPQSAKASNHPRYAFEDMDMVNLASLYYRSKIHVEELERFADVLFSKISNSLIETMFFCPRDKFELDVLMQINDGTQSEKNLAVILKRISTIIYISDKRLQEENYSPGRSYQSRAPHSKDYSQHGRPRNSYSGGYKKR